MSLDRSTIETIESALLHYPNVAIQQVVVLNKSLELVGSHDFVSHGVVDQPVILDLIREIRKWGVPGQSELTSSIVNFDYTTSQHSYHVMANQVDEHVMLYLS